jgi:putative membrane protein
MTGFLLRAVIVAGGLWLATRWVDGFTIDDSKTLLFAALLLGVVNGFLRPIAIVLTFPITVVTLGLFLLVVNAGMLQLVDWFIDDFVVDGFFPAVFAAIIVSLTSMVASWYVGPKAKYEVLVVRRRD